MNDDRFFRQILDRFKINYKLAVASSHNITAVILKLENEFVSTSRVLPQNVSLDLICHMVNSQNIHR